MNILCCIPARYGSTRLLGKPLLELNKKTMIHHVYDRASGVKYINNIIVLTDSEDIKKEVLSFGGKCEIINETCSNGTERIINYLKKYNNNNVKYDAVLNIQGDEPFINPEHINKIIENYFEKKNGNNSLVCSTMYYTTNNKNEVTSRSRVKIVLNNNNDIIYCSRNVIPATKYKYFDESIMYKIHIGAYIYDYDYLVNKYLNIHEFGHLQLLEDIEWLKIIEQGYSINAVKIDDCERGVDTEEDYKYLINKYYPK